jgi:hypothetical protein
MVVLCFSQTPVYNTARLYITQPPTNTLKHRRAKSLKYVRISVAGSIDEPIVFLLRRGVTAGVITKQLQLEDHILFALPTSEQPAYSLLPSDDVYCEARSGDPLLAVPASEAEELSVRQEVYKTFF